MNRRTALTSLFASAGWLAADHYQERLPDIPYTNFKRLPEISYTQFSKDAQAGAFSDIFVDGNSAIALPLKGKKVRVVLPDNVNLPLLLKDAKTQIWFKGKKDFIARGWEDFEVLFKKYGPVSSLIISGFNASSVARRERKLQNIRKSLHHDEERNTAYHEAGHALLGLLRPGINNLADVSIVAGHGYMGVTQFLSYKKIRPSKRTTFYNELIIGMGGRAAEKILWDGDYTAGAVGDLEQCKALAERMVSVWGMSKKIGSVNYGVLTGLRGIWNRRFLSPEKLREIELEVEALHKNAEKSACELLLEHRDKLQNVAEALLKHKTLKALQVREITGLADPDEEPLPS